MLFVYSDRTGEGGPPLELVQAMNRYNEELAKAGALLALDGLLPPSSGARVTFSGKGGPTVTDGPFTEAKEFVGGYWIIQARSHEEAVEWALRAPLAEGTIEVRRIAEGSDYGPEIAEASRLSSPLRSRPSPSSGPQATRARIDAIWRIESARVIATVARMVRDVGVAEDLAQDAVVAALERWPETGIPPNPGGWLTATAKHRAIDLMRRSTTLQDKYAQMARELGVAEEPDLDAELDDDIGDDVLSLMFTCCHPVLSTEARVALTLRMLGGLSTMEIARAFLVPEPTVGQRISRAKKALAEAGVPFEVPAGLELAPRLASVLEVVYLIFNEGYAATAGDDWIRPALFEEALRLGRVLAGLAPDEPEVHGLVALMELQASRQAARTGPDGAPILLADQDRGRWDRLLIRRGLAALATAESLGRPAGVYTLQAAIAACHARARQHRGDRLGAHRRALRGARARRRLAGRRAEPGRGDRHGLRPAGRAAGGRRARRRRGARPLPPAAERARRPAGPARPERRGAGRVRTRGGDSPATTASGRSCSIARPPAPDRIGTCARGRADHPAPPGRASRSGLRQASRARS